MATPWQLHKDLMRVTEAEIARTSRRAAQLADLRAYGDDRRLRHRLRVLLGALVPGRRRRRQARGAASVRAGAPARPAQR